ncbi:MAG TPA: hypothetical protein VGK40_00415 [Verrucomicrobiae bacterium]|jgi:hypothetical protein
MVDLSDWHLNCIRVSREAGDMNVAPGCQMAMASRDKKLRSKAKHMTHTTRIPVLLRVLLTLALIAPAGLAKANINDFKIRLTSAPGFAAVEANAKFRDRGGVQVFSSTINNALGLAGMVLTVSVNGIPLGTMTVNVLGVGDFTLSTELGQVVPRIRAGSFVEIRTSSGLLVASGTF